MFIVIAFLHVLEVIHHLDHLGRSQCCTVRRLQSTWQCSARLFKGSKLLWGSDWGALWCTCCMGSGSKAMGHVQTKEEQIEARKKDRHKDGKQRQSGGHKGTCKAVAWASLHEVHGWRSSCHDI